MKVVDRLRQSFNATSTATITLGGAVTGFRTIAEAIAHGDLAIGDEVPMCVESVASWELSLYRVDNPTQLTRLEVLASWTGGAAVTFPGGLKQIFCAAPAQYLNGIQVGALPVQSIADATRLLALNPSNEAFLVTAAVLKAYIGGTAPPADSTAPGAPTNLASTNVGQTGYTITFTPGNDNVAVARSEWSLDGSTWTPVSGGAAGNTFAVSGRTAGSTDTVRVRTVDTSGSVSAAATLSVTLQSAGGNAAPVISGSIAKTSIASSGYTFAWDAPTDANGNGSKVQTSIDGGSTWTDHAFAAGSRTVTGRSAGSTDQLRVRAVDAASAISNVLSDSVTMLNATPAMADTYAATPGVNFPASSGYDGGAAPNRYWAQLVNVYIKNGADYPAQSPQIRCCWGKSPTTPPVAFSNGSWPGEVPFSANGGNSGAVPNSVQGLVYLDQNGYPGLFSVQGTVYGGGSPGNYYLWVLYPDGSAEAVQTPVAVA